MLELIGYMVAAYGTARLLLAGNIIEGKGPRQLVAALGVIALVVLAAMLQQQADTFSTGLSGLYG